MENEIDILLDEYDELTEDLYFCKTDLNKRCKLLKKRLLVRQRINDLLESNKLISK